MFKVMVTYIFKDKAQAEAYQEELTDDLEMMQEQVGTTEEIRVSEVMPYFG